MHDRFKFRAYIKYSKSLHDIDSFYIDKLKKKVTIHFADCHTKSFKFEDIILTQCTGLKDKNGNLVYEGDLIKDENGCYCYVVWFMNGFWVKSPISEAMDFESQEFYESSEIVGNIHKNKDLLKGFKNEN